MRKNRTHKYDVELARSVQHDRLMATLGARIADVVTAEFLWINYFAATERRCLAANFNSAFKELGTLGMWKKLRGGTSQTATVEIAFLKGEFNAPWRELLLRQLGTYVTEHEARESATTNQLVMLDNPRTLYWAGKLREIEWERFVALWEFWFELCKAAKSGDPLDKSLLREDGPDTYLKHRKNNLGDLSGFPAELFDLIVSAGSGTYKLELSTKKIRIFVKRDEDEYEEFLSRKSSRRNAGLAKCASWS